MVIRLTLLLAVVLSGCQREQFKETIKALPPGGTATDPKTGVAFTFHQKNAGVPDESGWVAARSVPCGFEVSLPGPYNDFSQVVPATDGGTVKIHLLGTRTVEGAKFTVNCTERSDNAVPPSWKEDVVASLRADNPNLVQQNVTVAGVPGIQFSIQTPETATIGRMATVDRRAYQLIVEYPQSEAGYMPELAEMFFSSFRTASR